MAKEYVFLDEWEGPVDADPDRRRAHPRPLRLDSADRPLLRYLSPILRPIFRWNHNWSVARARDGLEPFARTRFARPVGAAK